MTFGVSLSALLDRVVTFYGFLIFVWVVLSWFPVREGFLVDVYRTLGSIVEPYVGLFRRFLPMAAVGGAGLDFSPFVALMVLYLIVRPLLVGVLASAGL